VSNEAIDRQQQKIAEFLRLLPLTTAIAGLPDAEAGRHFNEGQMEVRATTLRNAYKVARQLLLEIVK
jgi:predicted transcriptional regulator